jgi:hypothetical protein
MVAGRLNHFLVDVRDIALIGHCNYPKEALLP